MERTSLGLQNKAFKVTFFENCFCTKKYKNNKEIMKNTYSYIIFCFKKHKEQKKTLNSNNKNNF